jgi:adenosylmethionine-8-amino-7-oxononanoate aminotransferase
MFNKKSLSERSKASVWHPFTQMQIAEGPIGIVKGEGSYLYTESGNKFIDAISSWWTCIHGHAHPYIADKLSEQAHNLEHVMFAGFTHEPAVQLAENLLSVLPPNQAKIFYSDNGSTAVEVGLKMAFQYWKNLKQEKTKIIAFNDSYHGDTFGAMSVGSRSAFTEAFFPFLFDVEFVESPARNSELCLTQVEALLSKGDVAAIVYEPLVQGAGGMLMYTAEVLDKILSLCQRHEALSIADEVMTGFCRTGKFFASNEGDFNPDIMCLSKGLTGGVMAMGVTSCTQEIYDAFLSDHFMEKTFFHGHSFTANPMACAAANASFELLEKEATKTAINLIHQAHLAFLERIKDNVNIVLPRVKGTILAIDVKSDAETNYANAVRDEINHFFLNRGILLRPLGNTLYVMPPYCISKEDLDFIYETIEEYIN